MVAVGELMLDGSDDGEVIYIYNAWAWGGPGSAWARGLARGAGRVACAPTKPCQTPCAWACDMVGA